MSAKGHEDASVWRVIGALYVIIALLSLVAYGYHVYV